MKTMLAIARKELNGYFGSPMALIFIAVFLAASLFTFFWVETFFARGIADLRPLFKWMPVLLIFLVAALTMRQWSEEQRSGTLEMLLTLPVPTWKLVLGKFLSVMALVALALVLTLPLTLTVAHLGNVDGGPVIGAYLAALLLAAAYAAIGLFVSSRTDNQIVALIVTLLVGGALYLLGTSALTDFAGNGVGDILRALGTGSRFESIERGVIDLRDLVYYLSLTGIFLTLNVLSLDRQRWSQGSNTATYRFNTQLTSGLLVANLLLVNVWLYPLQRLRADLTEQGEFSLSPTTRDLLANVQEPLLIRAYISDKTHPLLAPLAPRIRDLLSEYQIAGRGKVTAEVLDPSKDPTVETEANQTYGIQPTPLQVAGRYEASVINTYFDILVRYGDQNTVLNFRDLIEVQPSRDGAPTIQLRNLEYDLTRAIKKVTSGFQSIDAVLASMKDPVRLLIVSTPDTLPKQFKDAPAVMEKVARDLAQKSNGKFAVEIVNPDDPKTQLNRQALQTQYRLRPTPVSLFSSDSFYLNMVLIDGNKTESLFPEGDFNDASVRTAIESALKRNSGGFLKVIGLWTPPNVPDQFGQSSPTTWQSIQQQLQRDYTVKPVELTSGQVPPDIDMLLVVGPNNLDDKARYAIDQYLMQGGSVVVAAGHYMLSTLTGSLGLMPVQNGLNDMLDFYGIKIGESLVMDPQNEPFPAQVNRQVGNSVVQEYQAVDYPFFVDVRPDAMDTGNPIVSKLSAVTMNFVSPLTVDEAKNKDRKVSTLLKSTAQSWLRTNPDIQPNFDANPDTGFAVEGERKSQVLAVAVQGAFTSYFKGKSSPLIAAPVTGTKTSLTGTVEPIKPASALETSPDTARLVVIGSSEFLDDLILRLSSQLTQDRYLNNLQLAQNAVDWSVEDLDLLSIRARGTVTRVLQPLSEGDRRFWEIANYAIALMALVAIGGVWRMRQRAEAPMSLTPMKDEAGRVQLGGAG